MTDAERVAAALHEAEIAHRDIWWPCEAHVLAAEVRRLQLREAALLALVNEHEPLGGPWRDAYYCIFCEAEEISYGAAMTHATDCPWENARDLLAASAALADVRRLQERAAALVPLVAYEPLTTFVRTDDATMLCIYCGNRDAIMVGHAFRHYPECPWAQARDLLSADGASGWSDREGDAMPEER